MSEDMAELKSMVANIVSSQAHTSTARRSPTPPVATSSEAETSSVVSGLGGEIPSLNGSTFRVEELCKQMLLSIQVLYYCWPPS
ncbi:hypothetical protein ACHQM5_024673 [Ranunculus cassubicifolius]